MSTAFASRITRSPRPYDPDRGAAAQAQFPDLRPELQEVIAGAGGCSPYLKSLMEREAQWAAVAPTLAPETALEAVLAEAALSFLGLGTQPPQASWGLMIQASRQFLDIAPWTALVPGAALAITILGLNLLGDVLRDILDPRVR